MSCMTPAELDGLKQKASRRLSFRESTPKEEIPQVPSSFRTPKGFARESMESNSTVEIIQE